MAMTYTIYYIYMYRRRVIVRVYKSIIYIYIRRVHAVLAKTLSPKNRGVDAFLDGLDIRMIILQYFIM